jgi:Tfp pilus assembly protein PilF
MDRRSKLFRIFAFAGIALLSQALIAQRSSGSGNAKGNSSSNPSTLDPSGPGMNRPMFITGKVLLSDGAILPEPVAIERACNGSVRREGYSDSKGQFSFQLGVNNAFQDASEGGARVKTSIGKGVTPTTMNGCEFRAILPGFQSSVATLHTDGETWQFDVGTIVLKRLGNAPGTTISMTSMAAPKDAMHAYEKAQALIEEKPDEAKKNLEKAVEKYPHFAAAWTMLGDLHRKRNEMDEAEKDYKMAIAADPQFVNPVYGMGMIAIQQKRWEEAATYTEQVLKLNVYAYPLTYFLNAAASLNAQKFEAAEDSGKKFKALDTQHSHPEICLLLSNVYAHKEDYASAAQEVNEYLTLVPNSPEAEGLKSEAKRFQELSASAKKN